MKYLLVLAAILGIVAVGSANSFAATDIYMQYGTIKGDSAVKQFSGWTPLASFQFGIDRPTTIGSGTSGIGAGAPKFSEITITKPMDISSAPLMGELLTGTPQTVKIDLARTASTGEQTFAAYDLTNALVTGYSVSSGGDVPTETITIAFEKIAFTFTPQNLDGTSGTPSNPVTWDLATNIP